MWGPPGVMSRRSPPTRHRVHCKLGGTNVGSNKQAHIHCVTVKMMTPNEGKAYTEIFNVSAVGTLCSTRVVTFPILL